jgi:alpha-beta hydrolase superfamily lysophospholipase
VLIVHGLNEHSGRYERVGEQLSGAGLETYAYDHRGNGGSAGRRGHVERWSELHDDLEGQLGALRDAAGGRATVLYGHSMGGLVVAGYLETDRPQPDLAVLTAPGLDSTLAAWKKALAPYLARIVPTLAVPNGIDPATLSRDPAVGRQSDRKPSSARSSTTRFGAEALAEQRRVRAMADAITVPTLVLHGLDDRLVPAASSEVLTSSAAVERRTYPGLRHELHNEPEGPEVIEDIITWIRDRATLPAQPNTASGERLER